MLNILEEFIPLWQDFTLPPKKTEYFHIIYYTFAMRIIQIICKKSIQKLQKRNFPN